MATIQDLLVTGLLVVMSIVAVNGQTTPRLAPTGSDATTAPASDAGGTLAWSNFEYQDGNTAGLAGPQQYPDGLNKGQVAGIVIGCVLFGLLVGALATLCWLKRRRLFPERFGPPLHPNAADPIGPLDVLHTGSKLDAMTKTELSNTKSFTSKPQAVVNAHNAV